MAIEREKVERGKIAFLQLQNRLSARVNTKRPSDADAIELADVPTSQKPPDKLLSIVQKLADELGDDESIELPEFGELKKSIQFPDFCVGHGVYRSPSAISNTINPVKQDHDAWELIKEIDLPFRGEVREYRNLSGWKSDRDAIENHVTAVKTWFDDLADGSSRRYPVDYLNIEIDESSRTAYRNDKEAKFTEDPPFRVFVKLAKAKGTVCEHNELLKAGWGDGEANYTNLERAVSTIRQNTGSIGLDVKNERSIGYQLILR